MPARELYTNMVKSHLKMKNRMTEDMIDLLDKCLKKRIPSDIAADILSSIEKEHQEPGTGNTYSEAINFLSSV